MFQNVSLQPRDFCMCIYVCSANTLANVGIVIPLVAVFNQF
jgi:hypothetical protein